MKKREPVTVIMTREVLTVNVKDDLLKVKEVLRKENIRHVPVVSGEKLVGILSRTDIHRLSFGNMFENQEQADDAILEMLSIEQVMHGKPSTVTPTQTIKEVADIFANEEFHALPVVENDKLVGIVTTTDIIKYLLKQY